MRTLIALTLALIVSVTFTPHASAAPAEQCVYPQYDMAGVYESSTMRAIVHICNVTELTWVNQYGVHSTNYYGVGRLVGNGLMTRGDVSHDFYMDSSPYLGIKAAERGFIELVTYWPAADPYNMPVRDVYKLRKVY
jgi:hypothetical protein